MNSFTNVLLWCEVKYKVQHLLQHEVELTYNVAQNGNTHVKYKNLKIFKVQYLSKCM